MQIQLSKIDLSLNYSLIPMLIILTTYLSFYHPGQSDHVRSIFTHLFFQCALHNLDITYDEAFLNLLDDLHLVQHVM